MYLTTYRFIHDWLKIDLCLGYFQETTSVANEEKSLWSIWQRIFRGTSKWSTGGFGQVRSSPSFAITNPTCPVLFLMLINARNWPTHALSRVRITRCDFWSFFPMTGLDIFPFVIFQPGYWEKKIDISERVCTPSQTKKIEFFFVALWSTQLSEISESELDINRSLDPGTTLSSHIL